MQAFENENILLFLIKFLPYKGYVKYELSGSLLQPRKMHKK